jgi:cytochrome P450
MSTSEHRSAPKAPELVPGPNGLPWVGSFVDAIRDPITMCESAMRAYGDIARFRMGPFLVFLVNDADAIRHVLARNHDNYVKSRSYEGFRLVLGHGLLTSEHEFWRRQRKLMQPAFHHQHLAGFVTTMVDSTQAMLARWNQGARGGDEFDAHAEMMRLTLRVVGLTLFSVDLDREAVAVAHAVSDGLHFVDDYASSPVRLPLWLPLPGNLRLRRALRTLDQLVYRVIAEHRRQPKPDLLGMLLDARDENGEGMTDAQVRDEVATVIVAGHETTANALTWALALLGDHPRMLERLASEVDEVLDHAPPTLERLGQLVYTEQVVQEAMRLYPPAWMIEREALADDELCGYRVPARSIIAISPYTLHRYSRYWDRPTEFDPDRFARDRLAAIPRYAYLPFGAGPRICIGNAFALMEAKIILAMIVQRYRLLRSSSRPLELDPRVTLRPLGGLRMRRFPRHARA